MNIRKALFLSPLLLLVFLIPQVEGGTVILSSETDPTPQTIPTIDFNGRNLSFVYTDENKRENLIIRTTQETYYGFSSASVFTSVTNISPDNQLVDLQLYFSNTREGVSEVFVLVKDFSFQIDVRDYDNVEHLCRSDFVLNIDQYGENRYECSDTGELFYCDIINRSSCTINNEFVGTHEETRFEDRWIPIQTTSPRDTQTQRELLTKTIRS